MMSAKVIHNCLHIQIKGIETMCTNEARRRFGEESRIKEEE